MLLSSSLPSVSVEIELSGRNPSFVPNSQNESYIISIYDSNFIYFSTTITVAPEHKLKPLSEGLNIARSTPVVNAIATYTITGVLPQGLLNGRLVFNGTTTIPIASVVQFNNMKLGEFKNPVSSNWETYESVSILNDTHILFLNNTIRATPNLQSLTLPQFLVNSISYNKNMRINT